MITFSSLIPSISAKAETHKKFLTSLVIVTLIAALALTVVTVSSAGNSALSPDLNWVFGSVAFACCIDIIFLQRRRILKPKSTDSLLRTEDQRRQVTSESRPTSTSSSSPSIARSTSHLSDKKSPLMQFLTKYPHEARSECIPQRFFAFERTGIAFPAGYQFEQTILDTAIINGDQDVLDAYLSPSGLYYIAERQTERLKTCMLSACSRGDPIFLEKICRLCPKDTPFYLDAFLKAAEAGSLPCLQILERFEAFTILKRHSIHASNALLNAMNSKNQEAFVFLLDRVSLENLDIPELCKKCFKSNIPIEFIKLLINKEDFYTRENVATVASFSQNIPLLRYLADQGKLNLNATKRDFIYDKTPFFDAVHSSNLELSLFLLNLSPSICMIKSFCKDNIFHFLSTQPRMLPVLKQLLLKTKEGIDQQNHKGESPVYCAIKAGHYDIALAFVEADADLHLQTGTEEERARRSRGSTVHDLIRYSSTFGHSTYPAYRHSTESDREKLIAAIEKREQDRAKSLMQT